MKDKLTIEMLNHPLFKNQVPFQGKIIDNPTGLNMTNRGEMLKYVVKIGAVKDWCVYTHWATNDWNYILTQGDKVISRQNVNNILDFDDEVWERYRF